MRFKVYLLFSWGGMIGIEGKEWELVRVRRGKGKDWVERGVGAENLS